ncbi:TIGR01777 family oxidoreductase [Rodentibacter trehalosifermentans]|uniref:TIGR01777 family protein n=1 Tax=Rodentibacter trehalosifermentans TaxID=1908263 RepID=A0A1V3IM78_9PAST|nr:TIGR01777 family oxidoreductase [Rodentibacter trehalosifermentans]OOF43271.1 TIGR01777 family protein [Rodentibacter trehalosifermentans]OOF52378.1 TIGR01777 family protein [Rodentibacter trehalosifermentans]
MHILITGGTGLIGQALVSALLQKQHQLTLLVRHEKKASALFPQKNLRFLTALSSFKNLDEFDVVINLAGEPIFAKRWTFQQKKKSFDSRVKLTQQLAALINEGANPPRFISGSATGIYGDRPIETLTETSPIAHNSFTARLCQAWENAALQAKTQVCLLRTAMVLSPKGGALKQMLPLYRWNLAGRLGSGEQYWAWIALEDMVRGIVFLLEHHQCHGVYNFVSPQPVTNKIFNQQLAQALKRCALFPAPRLVLKLILGERAALLLESQKVYPTRLLAAGFHFHYENFPQYLTALFPKK